MSSRLSFGRYAALVIARVVAGAVVLRAFGAPAWAVAAWLLAHTRISIGSPRTGYRPSPPSEQ
jgi:hypothetical protein